MTAFRQAPRRRVDRRAPPPAGVAALPTALVWLTRAGYVARGVVYLVIGATGLLLSVGLAERARGSWAVMGVVLGLPMGRLLLAALAVGLAGYATLSLVAAARAPEHAAGHAPGGPGRLVRAAAQASDAFAGVAYAGLAALAVRLLADPSADTGVASRRWAAQVLSLPGGGALLVAAGAVTLAAAAFLAYRALRLPVGGQLERRRVAPAVRRAIVALARGGIAARAVLFALCGALLVRAGWTGDARRVGGLGDALDALADAPAGPVLVALVALGCMAYGVYQVGKARYRRVRLVAAVAREGVAVRGGAAAGRPP